MEINSCSCSAEVESLDLVAPDIHVDRDGLSGELESDRVPYGHKA